MNTKFTTEATDNLYMVQVNHTCDCYETEEHFRFASGNQMGVQDLEINQLKKMKREKCDEKRA